jgi:hypothetical protein
MRRFQIISIVAALAAATPALAQTIQASYFSTPNGPVYTTMNECRKASAIPDMRRLDGNRDGRISSREFERNGSGQTTVSMFYSMDKNMDGFISRSELDAYRHVGSCRGAR